MKKFLLPSATLSIGLFSILFFVGLSVRASNGLIAYWSFDNDSGSVVNDDFGNYQGTNYRGMFEDGYAGSALNFSCVRTNTNLSEECGLKIDGFPQLSEYTLLYRFKFGLCEGDYNQRIVVKNDSFQTDVYGQKKFNTGFGDPNYHLELDNGNWYSFAYINDENGFSIYQDGEQVYVDYSQPVLSGEWWFGRDYVEGSNNTNSCDITLDEIKIYDIALTETQILEEYSGNDLTCTADTWTCEDWNSCTVDETQTRECTKIFDCPSADTPSPAATESCAYTAPTCSSWTYSDWGACSAEGQQTRTISLPSPGGCVGGSPVLTQSCTPPATCTEDTYECSEWSACSADGIQTRTCNLTYNCTSIGSEPPVESQSCASTIPTTESEVPSITSIFPQTITPGETITITGSNFGSSRDSSKLVSGSGSSLSGTILSWTDSQITYATSTYYDTTSKKIGVKKCESYTNCADPVYGSYIYIQPSITSLSVSTGAVGTQVTIYGTYLKHDNLNSDTGGYYYLDVAFNGTSANVTTWEDTYIVTSVPSGATDGQVSIKMTADGVSTSITASGSSFNVLEAISNDTHSALQEYFKQVNIPDAWGISNNRREVVVAVIDDGIYLQHPEFADKIWQNTDEMIGNGIDDDKNGYIDDRYGWDFLNNTSNVDPLGSHGTKVAGIIGATPNNNQGIAGVNWRVKLMSVIVASDSSFASVEKINQAIRYAVDNGAEIINLSFGTVGTGSYSTAYNSAIQYAYDKNVLVVAAAGNGDPVAGRGDNLNNYPKSPVCNDNGKNMVIGVGAVDSENYLTPWSNYGNNCVDIYAPGENILSTDIPTFNSGYLYKMDNDGTSFSAPIVTGIVSLLKAAYPTITSQESINLLIANANAGVVDAYKTLSANFTPTTRQISSQTTSSNTTNTNTSTGIPALEAEVDVTGWAREDIINESPVLIKTVCPGGEDVHHPCRTVYFLDNDGMRYAFPNERAYFTWYDAFLEIHLVTDATMASYHLAGNVTYHPGKKLVKFPSVPTVYAVARYGELRPIASEPLARELYGDDWAKKVDDVSEAFYGNYRIGEPITSHADFDVDAIVHSVNSINDNIIPILVAEE